MPPTTAPPVAVSVMRLADGLIVQLRGSVTSADLPQLRRALLMPLSDAYRDILVDAGELSVIDDAALAALLAARDWANASGRRFAMIRSSAALVEALEELALAGALPALGPPQRPSTAGVPAEAEPATPAEPTDLVPRPRRAHD